MFEIVFLGTSSAAPSIYRGLPALAVLAGEHRFLVDCGEGTQRQILRSRIGYKRLNHILITHSHLDHILGVGGLVSTFTRWEASIDELHFYGGRRALERIHSLIYDVVLRGEPNPAIPIYLHEIGPGVIFEAKAFTVSAFPVQHRGQGCFGFIFQERDRRPFLAEKASELGVPFGPERSALVKGDSITLKDGRVITPDMVLGETIQGTKVVITGDTGRTDNIVESARDADALVCEATFLDKDRDMARQFGHITAQEAAILARDAGARNLLLQHISRRYREADMIHEVRSLFPHSHVARDLDHFIVKRGERIEKKQIDVPTDEVDDVDETSLG